MGGGDWKDSRYRRFRGRTEDLGTSRTHKLQELGGLFALVGSSGGTCGVISSSRGHQGRISGFCTNKWLGDDGAPRGARGTFARNIDTHLETFLGSLLALVLILFWKTGFWNQFVVLCNVFQTSGILFDSQTVMFIFLEALFNNLRKAIHFGSLVNALSPYINIPVG